MESIRTAYVILTPVLFKFTYLYGFYIHLSITLLTHFIGMCDRRMTSELGNDFTRVLSKF